MIGVIVRLLWRLLVLALAILLAYASAFVVLPYLDRRLPVFPAILIVYIALAYFGIPALVRIWRLVIKPDHLPVFVTTGDGWASDPVNIIVVSRGKRDFYNAMKQAGWLAADPSTLRNLVREAYCLLFNKPYPTAPFSSLYLFGRKQDIGFQIQTGNPPTPRHRHHARFWQLHNRAQPHSQHHFWQFLLFNFLGQKRHIWIGAATHDVASFAIRWRNGQLTHQIDENTDKERDFVIKTLTDTGYVHAVSDIKAGEPFNFRGQTFGVDIVIDGYVKVVELKRPTLTKRIQKLYEPDDTTV